MASESTRRRASKKTKAAASAVRKGRPSSRRRAKGQAKASGSASEAPAKKDVRAALPRRGVDSPVALEGSPTEPLALGAESETRATLFADATPRFGKWRAGLIADLICRTSAGGGWYVHKAALEALVRRQGYGKRDLTQVLRQPRKGIYGTYLTGLPEPKPRSKKKAKNATEPLSPPRHYLTELRSLDPLVTSCNCADFVRSSLGLCKHGMAVLESLEPKAATRPSLHGSTIELGPLLFWDPIQPFTGGADRLRRLRRHEAGVSSDRFVRECNTNANADAKTRTAWITEQLNAIELGHVAAEPAVGRVLEEELVRAQRLAENLAALSSAERCLVTLKRKLYEYQKVGVQRILRQGRLLLADDMGLGKTTQAIAACHALYGSQRVRRGLLVVPAALKAQWLREWQEVTDTPIVRVEGAPADRQEVYRSADAGFLLVGYEQLMRDLTAIHAYAPDLVLLDEGQRIKNWATKSAQSVKTLQPKFRLVLTGTPMENRLDELASIMDFVDDTALEPKWRLVPLHSVTVADSTRTSGIKHLDTLRLRLGESFLRRRRQEVLDQLPARCDTRVDVEITEPQLQAHRELDVPISSLVSRSARRPLTQAEFLRLMQLLTQQRMICNGLAQVNFEVEWPRCSAQQAPSPTFFDSLASPKLTVFRSLIEQLLTQERKVVVFSQWLRMLKLAHWSIKDLLHQAGLLALFFTGAERPKQRERAIVDFHDDPRAQILFLSDAGGVGLNLQHAASCCINLELPWNPAVLEQRIGRIYRLGQRRPIDVYNLVTAGGIETRIANLVAHKKAAFSGLFDGTSDEVRFDDSSSFLEGIAKLVDGSAPVAPLGEARPSALDAAEGPGAALDAADAEDDDAEDDDAEDELTSMVGETNASDGQPDEWVGDITAGGQVEPADTVSLPPAGDLVALMSDIQIVRTPEGWLQINASPAVAVPLAALLETLAQSLRQSVR